MFVIRVLMAAMLVLVAAPAVVKFSIFPLTFLNYA